MNERDWRLLVTLHKTKNITKASEELYLTQPALTYRIKMIENEFGVKIVNRSNKGVQFTAEGEFLAQYANEMLLKLTKTKDHLLNMGDTVQGNLRIGVSSNFAHYKLPSILKNFLKIYPNVQVSVKTGWSSEIIQLLRRERVHIGIVRGDYTWNEEKILIDEENICLISKGRVNIDDLPTLGRVVYKTDPLLKQLIDNWWFKNFNQPPFLTMEVDRVETSIEMVKNGLGYAIVPRICLKPNDKLHTVNLSLDGEPILRGTWMFYSNSSLKLSTVKAFVEFLIDEGAVKRQ